MVHLRKSLGALSLGLMTASFFALQAYSVEDLIHAGIQPAATLALVSGIPVIKVNLANLEIDSLDGLDRLTVTVEGHQRTVPVKSLENIYLVLSGNKLGQANERLLTFDLLGDKLVGVNLSANKFKAFPAPVKQISHLRILDLSDNQLSDDSGVRFNPVNVPVPVTVEVLNLSGNLFTCCPRGFPSYGKLRSINLACNKISNEQFSSYAYGDSLIPKTVEELVLQGNLLKTVPQGIASYGKMRVLNLADNQITDAQCCNSFGESYIPHGTEHLDLSGNKLTEPPFGIRTLFKLRELDLSDNPINQSDFYNRYHECLLPGSLEKIGLAGTNIVHKPAGFKALTKLHKITMGTPKVQIVLPFNINESCPICLDVNCDKKAFEAACQQQVTTVPSWKNAQGEQLVALSCRHAVCKPCLKKWIKKKGNASTCPLCRAKISVGDQQVIKG